MRIGVIGAGHVAQWLHVPAARSIEGATLIGAADPNEAARASWTSEIGAPCWATEDELYEHTSPDLVVIASPPQFHRDSCLRAIEHGAHVICEKPFAATVAEADEVVAAAAAAGVVVAVNQEFRFMPIFSSVFDSIDTPKVGRPYFVHCTQFMDLPPWAEEVAWRAAMSKRSLFEGGVHIVDLVYRIIGRLPKSVHAVTSAGFDPPQDADAIHLVTLDFGDGVLAQLTIDRLSRTGTRYVDLRVDCEQASLRSSYGGRAFLQVGVKRGQRPGVRFEYGLEGMSWAERGLKRKTMARNPKDAAVRATEALYADAVNAIRTSGQPAVSAATARDVLRIIEASYESAASGEVVHLET